MVSGVQPDRPPALTSQSTSDATDHGLERPQPSRPRASTLNVSTSPAYASVALANPSSASPYPTPADIFDTLVEQDDQVTASLRDATSPRSPHAHTLDELPIELRSLTERFLQSLTAKTYPSPLSIDAIAELYQDFYHQAESHTATHIAARASLLSRANKACSPIASKKDAVDRSITTGWSQNAQDTSSNGEQQMLTASEIADRRRARRHLQLQKDNLDEAVERVVCETLYDRIYRHRSGDDEERDAKLRSKTAALNLLGIGLKELHVNIQASKLAGTPNDAAATINQLLAPARDSLQRMDDEHFPLGKLRHLKAAHKGIVETLAHLFPSSSSADEVLPTLIYTLVTSQPETLNAVSNLHFVQLFRAASRLDGETAYCVVNLEAAISFLETVDLSSLNTDRSIDQPSNPSDALTLPTGDNPLMASSESLPLPPVVSTHSSSPVITASGSAPTVGPGHQRRLSSMIQSQKDRIEAGRESLANTADQALDSINTTLDNSIKFLFGRMQQQAASPAHNSPITMPKTLDEARQLVGTPSPDDQSIESRTPGPQVPEKDERSKIMTVTPSSDPLAMSDSKLMDVFGGKGAARDRSTDSRASTSSSNKHVSFASADKNVQSNEGVGGFVNSLNPLSRFSVPSFPRFGRSASGPQPQTPPLGTSSTPKKTSSDTLVTGEVELNAVETLAQLRSAEPPVQRYVDMNDVNEMRIGDVQALLLEYQRLAAIVKQATL